MTSQRRLMVRLLSAFATVALLLAGIGIYGVLSYLVTQRTQEIGVRMALGASKRGVVALVLGDLMWPVILGLAAGLAGTLVLSKTLASLVYKMVATDPLVLGTTCCLLLVLAVLAAFIPARRAAQLDPLVALRLE